MLISYECKDFEHTSPTTHRLLNKYTASSENIELLVQFSTLNTDGAYKPESYWINDHSVTCEEYERVLELLEKNERKKKLL